MPMRFCDAFFTYYSALYSSSAQLAPLIALRVFVPCMSVPHLLPLPCCCLLNTGGTWSEFLILEKLKDHHWLCVDINWSYREIGCFESAVLQTSHGSQVCRFGKLDDSERFTDTDLQSDACLVFFLRTTADGHPLPSIREGLSVLAAPGHCRYAYRTACIESSAHASTDMHCFLGRRMA